ncbi:protein MICRORCHIDIA 7-like isoform X2 [Cornus florida]|uniref:protein MICRORCHIDIA 7-like isoform X2 n=1 Tax=Cornus florida TaxID=4283 RepID=UPI00289B0AA7|nr:protein MICRORCHIDIA 7-like isoform X2 [Cornus florida]
MDVVQVKQEVIEASIPKEPKKKPEASKPMSVIDLSSSDSDSDSSDDSSSDDDVDVLGLIGKRTRVSNGAGGGSSKKKKKLAELGAALPVGFLDPLPRKEAVTPPPPLPQQTPLVPRPQSTPIVNASTNKQFWKAGDYEGTACGDWDNSSGGMDHVRVHPKFLHSNATSHKWVLGGFAELLDNSLDEVCNGATYVNIDMLNNKKDGSKMLLIEDDGGGMDPDRLRQCMSLGYSLKSKVADTIGQYGNGFKTSTMRLGADVIVFSRSPGKKRPTQSIGLLSYTFLKSTGKEDIVVPMLDYERGGQEWNKLIRSSAGDWNKNVETIVRWSPFSSEVDLMQQFDQMKDHGTRIIIYNLWEDDQGQLELDFDSDPYDIQIRGVNRDEKKIQMAKQFPNSRHFLTYRHSFRSYASILYLRIPPAFRIILRGKDVVHHNVVNDMMFTQEVTYRPQPGTDGIPKDSNMIAVVTIGFVKDAQSHIDVQGFNVYHKNRLIKPFWRLWNAAGSNGRGVIGVLEANFVEPAHDKQGFERTTVLSRLEARLVQMQKTYWYTNCHKIGYVAPHWNKKNIEDKDSSPDHLLQTSSQSKNKYSASNSKRPIPNSGKSYSSSNQKLGRGESERYPKTVNKSRGIEHLYINGDNRTKTPTKSGKVPSSSEPPSPSGQDVSDDVMQTASPERQANSIPQKARTPAKKSFVKGGSHTTWASLDLGNTEAEIVSAPDGRPVRITRSLQSKLDGVSGNGCPPSDFNSQILDQLKEENRQLKERLKRREEDILGDLLRDLQYERERCRLLETKLLEATRKAEELNKEQESLVDIFSEERERRDSEEETLRKKLKIASNTIQELLDKVRILEKNS